MSEPTWPPKKQETVLELFNLALAERPDEIYIDMVGDTRTFRQIEHEANKLAHGLKAAGVQNGDTVCGLTDTSMDSLLVWFAVNKLGAIWVPINSALKGEFLRHQIEDCGAKLMIADSHYVERIQLVAERLKTLEALYIRGDRPAAGVGALNLETFEALRSERTDPLAAEAVKPRDLSLIIYTSGTTGPSKGCGVSHNYVCNYAREMSWASGWEPGDRVWFALPLFHLGGLGAGVIGSLVAGCRAVIAKHFSVSGFWPDVERSGANRVIGVGATVALVAEAADTDAMQRCRGQIKSVTAAPLTPAHQEKLRTRFGIKHAAAPGYGLTEASMVTLYPIYAPQPPGASGRRFADFEVRVVDDDGAECPPGTPGQILVRPNNRNIMFNGYWKRPEATVATQQDYWFNTGDMGKFDQDGFFYFVDRAKDYLRRRGENISSFEVETSLRDHPAIVDVAVHAVRSDVSEDDLKATVVIKDGATVTEEELCRWSINVLPFYAVPRFIEFRNELPRNPIGRVLKYQLRDEGVTPTTWDRMSCPDIIVKR